MEEQKGLPVRLREASCLNCRKYSTFRGEGCGGQCCPMGVWSVLPYGGVVSAALWGCGQCCPMGGGADLLQVLYVVVPEGEDLEATQPVHAIKSANPVVCQTQVSQFVQ